MLPLPLLTAGEIQLVVDAAVYVHVDSVDEMSTETVFAEALAATGTGVRETQI